MPYCTPKHKLSIFLTTNPAIIGSQGQLHVSFCHSSLLERNFRYVNKCVRFTNGSVITRRQNRKLHTDNLHISCSCVIQHLFTSIRIILCTHHITYQIRDNIKSLFIRTGDFKWSVLVKLIFFFDVRGLQMVSF